MDDTPAPARRPRRRNADYRWTMPKVTAFLEALSRCGCVAEAARSVGMGRQSAYRLRARLGDAQFARAFEGARKMGIRARAAASRERNASPWDGPLAAAYFRARQGDTHPAQGNPFKAQGDALPPQGDAPSRKATQTPLDTVTGVTGRRPRRPVRNAPPPSLIGSGRTVGER